MGKKTHAGRPATGNQPANTGNQHANEDGLSQSLREMAEELESDE